MAQTPLHRLIAKKSAPSICADADATAWIAASGIADSTGIHQFFCGLKDSSLYTHLANSGNGAMWLLFGGSINAVKLNIFDPVDSDASFRLTASGTWDYASNGVLGTGSASLSTQIASSAVLSKDSKHLSVYSVTNGGSNGADIGNSSVNNSSFDGIFIVLSGSALYYLSDLGNNNVSNANTTGYYIGTRTGASAVALYKNGVSIASASTASSANQNTSNIHIGVANAQPSNRRLALASVGPGLTADQTRALNFLVEQLMDARGIGVQ